MSTSSVRLAIPCGSLLAYADFSFHSSQEAFVGASVHVVGSRQVPGRAWVHLAVDVAAAGGLGPVGPVVTAELGQRLGWRWPVVDGSGTGSRTYADTGRAAAAG
jgi:hypothetical protein